MSEKNIKMKPKTTPKALDRTQTPKIAIKGKEQAQNTVKDIKAAVKDTLVKRAVDSKLQADTHNEQPKKADTEAAESVENMAYTSFDTALHKGKTFVQNRVKQHNRNTVKTREQAENNPPVFQDNAESEQLSERNTPKTREYSGQNPKNTDIKQPDIKTRDEYLKYQIKQSQNNDNSPKQPDIKTKENYIKGQYCKSVQNPSATKPKNDVKIQSKTSFDARRMYVTEKLKKNKAEKIQAKSEYTGRVESDTAVEPEHNAQNLPKTRERHFDKNSTVKTNEANTDVKISKASDLFGKSADISEQPKQSLQIKTKESYVRRLGQNRIEPKKFRQNSPKQNTYTAPKMATNVTNTAKTGGIAVGKQKNSVKSGSVYSKNTIKKKSVKAGKKPTKTQKEVTKKAAKEAAKRAKELAQKTAQITKIAVKAAVKTAVKVAQAVKEAGAALISALAAAGGGAVVIVTLIVVIIIAALAASPFGIFISNEVTEVGAIPLSQIIAECNVELTQEVENIELSVGHDDVDVIDNQANWNEILSVFAVKTAGTDDNTAEDVVVFDAAKAEKLKNVFRNANTVSYTTSTYTDAEGNTKIKLTITVTGKTKDELISMYSLNSKQQEAVETLLEHDDILTASSHSLVITDASVSAVLNGIPDSLPQKRKDVVKNAASLVGKVNYFWGGKSSAIGWDSAWGTMRRVTAAGSPSSGSIRAFGLDCSGFVTWVFNNSGMSVGYGTSGQKASSTLISESGIQAGDLAFVSDYSHVGIVVGRDSSGNILVIHCSSGANNVVLATASGVGFNIFRRPNCY